MEKLKIGCLSVLLAATGIAVSLIILLGFLCYNSDPHNDEFTVFLYFLMAIGFIGVSVILTIIEGIGGFFGRHKFGIIITLLLAYIADKLRKNEHGLNAGGNESLDKSAPRHK
jgi:hypothetical protein